MDNEERDAIGDTPRAEAGFGLIEIVISMFLLAMLAVSALPLLATAIKSSQVHSSVTTASQLVAQDIDRIRALPVPTCAEVQALAGTGAEVQGPAGVRYLPAIAVEACPTAFPGVVRVTARVTDGPSGRLLASAVTSVMVEGP